MNPETVAVLGLSEDVDPNDSPFEMPPIEGIPFDQDSEEARAIRRVIEEADRERPKSGR